MFEHLTLARVLMARCTTEREEQSFDEETRLIVSLNTVRTHTKNINAKIGGNSRRATRVRTAGCSGVERRQGCRPL